MLKSVFAACLCVSAHLYQWSDRVVRTIVRPDWKVRSGFIDKTVHMVVTPAVTVRVTKTVKIFMLTTLFSFMQQNLLHTAVGFLCL